MASKVKYYKLGDESDYEVISYDNKTVEINNVREKEKQEDEYSKTVSEGLKSVLDKDIEDLSKKLESINKKIVTTLATNNVLYDENLSNDVALIDDNLVKVENIISKVIIEKESMKIGIFSSKKNEKREKQRSLNEAIDFLTRCQNDIIALRDEYNKLVERKEQVKDIDKKEEKDTSASLEQTINFYLNQKWRKQDLHSKVKT